MILLVWATLVRRPARTLLSALGTAVGVATIVALLGVTGGLKETAGGLVRLGQGDLGLFQKDVADPTASVLPAGLARRLRATPGVADATPVQLLIEQVPRDPAAVVFGLDPRGFVAERLVFVSGRPTSAPGEVAVGDGLAARLDLRPGSTLRIAGRRFRVTGTYHTGILFEDEGAAISLREAQRVARRGDEATTIPVVLEPGVRAQDAERDITRRFPGLTAIGSPDDAARAGANGMLIGKAALVIVVLALIIGGISVANTMLLSVVERRGEFAVMTAVGWSGPQVAGLVLVEGVAISLLGAAVGLLLGAVGSRPAGPRARRGGLRLAGPLGIGAAAGNPRRGDDRRDRRALPGLARRAPAAGARARRALSHRPGRSTAQHRGLTTHPAAQERALLARRSRSCGRAHGASTVTTTVGPRHRRDPGRGARRGGLAPPPGEDPVRGRAPILGCPSLGESVLPRQDERRGLVPASAGTPRA